MTDKGWLEKEKRDIFSRICMTYIAKTGAEKDPIVLAIIKCAQQIVDEAFRIYPNVEDENKEVEMEFKK